MPRLRAEWEQIRRADVPEAERAERAFVLLRTVAEGQLGAESLAGFVRALDQVRGLVFAPPEQVDEALGRPVARTRRLWLQSELAEALLSSKHVLHNDLGLLQADEAQRARALHAMSEATEKLRERQRATRLQSLVAGRAAAELELETAHLKEQLEGRRAEYRERIARAEALEAAHLPAPEVLTYRRRLAEARDRVAACDFRLRQLSTEAEQLERDSARTRRDQHSLQTQMEIVEQAVESMHTQFFATAAELLGGQVGQPSAPSGSSPPSNSRPYRLVPGRGTGPEVPEFLRHAGMVRLHPLRKGPVELIVKQLWALKTLSTARRLAAGDQPLSLVAFVTRYTAGMFQEQAAEFNYNLAAGLDRFAYDADIEIFARSLYGDLSEEYYLDQIAMAAHLKKLLEVLDLADGCRDGLILPDVFWTGLRRFFPAKSERSFAALVEIVGRTSMSAGGWVDISRLLSENADGDESEFMEEVRDQYLSEVFQFPLDLRAALMAAGSALPVGQIAAILQELDPLKPLHDVESLVAKGLGLQMRPGTGPGQEGSRSRDGGSPTSTTGPGLEKRLAASVLSDPNRLVDVEQFCQQLGQTLVQRTGLWNSDFDVVEVTRMARRALAERELKQAASARTAGGTETMASPPASGAS